MKAAESCTLSTEKNRIFECCTPSSEENRVFENVEHLVLAINKSLKRDQKVYEKAKKKGLTWEYRPGIRAGKMKYVKKGNEYA